MKTSFNPGMGREADHRGSSVRFLFLSFCLPVFSLGLWVERRRWVAPYAGSLGSLFEGPLRGEPLLRAPLELRNQAVKQAEGMYT